MNGSAEWVQGELDRFRGERLAEWGGWEGGAGGVGGQITTESWKGLKISDARNRSRAEPTTEGATKKCVDKCAQLRKGKDMRGERMKNGKHSVKMKGEQNKPQKVNDNVLWRQHSHFSLTVHSQHPPPDFHLRLKL